MKKFSIQELGIIIVLVLLSIVFSILSPQFLQINNMFNIVKQVATLGMVSVGFTYVLISGGIDLSVGYQISLINVVCALLMMDAGVSWPVACAVGVVLGVLIGIVNGLIIAGTGVASLIVTLAMMIILRGTSYLISRGLPIFGFPRAFSVLGQGTAGPFPIPFIFLVVAVLIGSFVLGKTVYGRYFYALGSNEEAARLSGVNVFKVRVVVYGLNGLFTSIGSILMLSRLNSAQSSTGDGFELDVITACVLGGVSISGGKGTVLGAAIGVLIIGTLDNGLLLLNVSEYVKSIIKGGILLTAVIYDSLAKAKREQAKRMKAINAEHV
ncbi:MAG: ABC transporter permease [Spirochaetales bacterium]|nr:ABC transporter permease [Spirochaetales bacterium]